MLRLFNSHDLSALAHIETATQIAPWSQEVFKKCLEAGSDGWVIEIEGRIVGFVLVFIQVGEAHILNLCVHPDYQHRGYGEQLLAHALNEAKNRKIGVAFLEVRQTNRFAIALYKKLGFIQIGERKNYYATPEGREDALVFAKDLGAQ